MTAQLLRGTTETSDEAVESSESLAWARHHSEERQRRTERIAVPWAPTLTITASESRGEQIESTIIFAF
jgi:hypothetical protein